jgi:hypothetical protein
MNLLFTLWTAVRSVSQSSLSGSDNAEQQALEDYLCQSQTISDLERRDRQYMRSCHSGNDFFAASH